MGSGFPFRTIVNDDDDAIIAIQKKNIIILSERAFPYYAQNFVIFRTSDSNIMSPDNKFTFFFAIKL